MKLGNRRAMLLTISENIEMTLFSSDECCMVITTQERRDKNNSHQTYRYMEHPLVTDCEEDPKPLVHETQALVLEPQNCFRVMDLTDVMETEMEFFPPINLSDIELVEIKPGDSSIVTPTQNKVSRVKWKRLTPEKRGLVVKDVICLPRGHCVAELERQIAPQTKQQVAQAMGLTARITVDYSWSASQTESRLALVFQGQFVKKAEQRFTFTYLQCVQGSRVLFVPEAPVEGWTGKQVLRISEHGALYILSHHDYPQLTLNLDTILRLYRQVNMDRNVETHIQVMREDVLHSALKAVRRPGFCFTSTPIISFSEDETKSHEEPLCEFFRLTLLELTQSCVFEGRPGCLFFTYDLTALEDRKYYEAGVLIGWSLAQGGPGPCCLHPALYQLMCCQSPPLEDFNWKDIADTEAQIRLQELHCCHDVKLLSPSLRNWVSYCGIPRIQSAHSNEIPTIYACLVKHYIYHRVASMISQFIEGLNSCGGLWDLVKSEWEMFLPVMTSTKQQPLTLEEFKQLFTVCYSHADSELRAAEEATASHWETVLTLVSDGQTDFSFEDLLIFVTGADRLPPLGFRKLISLRFYSQGVNTSNLPHATVGSLELFLPRGVVECVDLLILLHKALHKALRLTQLQADGDGEENCSEGVMGF
ncbi:uncharacterized protein PAE49_016380 [Odontesthes bonariensis]